MKRLLALVLSAFALGAALSSCGGGGDQAGATADKLTVVGAGS